MFGFTARFLLITTDYRPTSDRVQNRDRFLNHRAQGHIIQRHQPQVVACADHRWVRRSRLIRGCAGWYSPLVVFRNLYYQYA